MSNASDMTFSEAIEEERRVLRAKGECSVVVPCYWARLLKQISYSTESLEDLVERLFLAFRDKFEPNEENVSYYNPAIQKWVPVTVRKIVETYRTIQVPEEEVVAVESTQNCEDLDPSRKHVDTAIENSDVNEMKENGQAAKVSSDTNVKREIVDVDPPSEPVGCVSDPAMKQENNALETTNNNGDERKVEELKVDPKITKLVSMVHRPQMMCLLSFTRATSLTDH